ncbi:MAG: hypothetical protein ACRCS6_08505 [Turicibacter sp.]
MEIKTKHKKFNNFTDLYIFMTESHLDEISVTMKYPDGTKSAGVMPLDMVLSFTSIEQIKTLDKDLKELATEYNTDLDTVREIAENFNELHYFNDEDGELQAQLDAIESSDELKQAVTQLVNEKLHAE